LSENQDKRKFLRTNKSLAVEYREDAQVDSVSNRTFLQDISVGGCRIITYHDYDPGFILNLRVGIPSDHGQWVDFKGKVVNSKHESGYKYSTRIQFIDLDSDQKVLIHEFVKLAHSIKNLKI
jgi:hypothetical protein